MYKFLFVKSKIPYVFLLSIFRESGQRNLDLQNSHSALNFEQAFTIKLTLNKNPTHRKKQYNSGRDALSKDYEI